MDFTLTYDGPLASNGRPAQKHDIRTALHPQLKELWSREPLQQFSGVAVSNITTVGKFNFQTIVHTRWKFRAQLKILMLKPEAAGAIVVSRGDIDNRLKTLFDALTRPQHEQDIPKSWAPEEGEDPLHCLLEDDGLITGVTVTTDRLLAAKNATHVKLVIRVHIQNIATFGGLAVLG